MSDMSKIVLGFAVLLIVLGVGFFAATGAKTALIPVIPGALLGIAGMMALKEAWHVHAMHGAMVVALLGFVAPLRAIGSAVHWAATGQVARPLAVVEQLLMSLLCLIVLVLGIRSFIVARRARQGEPSQTQTPETS